MNSISIKKIVKKIWVVGSLLFFFFLSSGHIYGDNLPGDTPPGGSNTGVTYECHGTAYGDCTWVDVINAVRKLVSWGTEFAIVFSVVVIAYAGFKYLTSGDNAGERKKANTMMWKVAQGLAYMIAAWIIVNLITSTLLNVVTPISN